MNVFIREINYSLIYLFEQISNFNLKKNDYFKIKSLKKNKFYKVILAIL